MKYVIAALCLSFSIFAIAKPNSFSVITVADTGKGNEAQYRVGEQMAHECKKIDCKFVILNGDNFYQVGVTSVDDPQFVTKFEQPYAMLDVPFLVTLGNHDYGRFANDWKRGDYQLEYSKRNPKFVLPAHYYAAEYEDTLFIFLDTSRLFHNKDTRAQTEFVRKVIRENTKKWIVVVGHHPYISNGDHGNAGSYDGVIIPPYSGSVIKKLFEEEICPHAHLVITAHDHSLQTLPGPARCSKPVFVVSGAGADADAIGNRNPAHFQKSVMGFTALHFNPDNIQIRHVNIDGEEEHSFTISQ